MSPIAILFALGLVAADVSPPSTETDPKALLALAKQHRDAVAGASRVEKEKSDLQVRLVVFPDALEWLLLRELIEGLEGGGSMEAVEARIEKARRTWRAAAGRPGFELELGHREAPEGSDRAKPRTIHLLPGDPEAMLHIRYGKRAVEWNPLEKPRGHLIRSKVRVAKHYTSKDRRRVPFIRELEPKGARWVFEGERATILGVLPDHLAEKRGESLHVSLPDFDRFHGPSPEPNLLDLNATGSAFDREQSLEVERPWPAPWPPLPAELGAVIGGGES